MSVTTKDITKSANNIAAAAWRLALSKSPAPVKRLSALIVPAPRPILTLLPKKVSG